MNIEILGDVVSGRISICNRNIITISDIEEGIVSAINVLGSSEMFKVMVPQKLFKFLEDVISSDHYKAVDECIKENILYSTLPHVVNEDRFIMDNARLFLKRSSSLICKIPKTIMKLDYFTKESSGAICIFDLVICLILDNIKHLISNLKGQPSSTDIHTIIFQFCDECYYIIDLLAESSKTYDSNHEAFDDGLFYYLLLICSSVYKIITPLKPPPESSRFYQLNTFVNEFIDIIKNTNFDSEKTYIYCKFAEKFEKLKESICYSSIDVSRTF